MGWMVEVEVGALWDFGNTSRTTALPGVCHHFLCRTTLLPEISSRLHPRVINREELMKMHTFTETGWMNCAISLPTARSVKEEKGSGKKHAEKFQRAPESCMLFVEGALQVLKWQIPSRTTWINIDSGPVSLMMAHAEVVSLARETERQVM